MNLERNNSKVSRNNNNIGYTKEIPISKSIQNEFKILFPKRFTSTHNINLRKKGKKNPCLFKRNKIINKTKDITRINSFEDKTKFLISYNSKSKIFYNPTIVQSNQNINISRNRTVNNSNNNSFYYITYRNSIKRNPNICFNKIKYPNYPNMMTNKINNTSLYNYSINNSNNRITNNNSNVSLKSNKFEISLKNKFVINGKDQLKNKILREKIKKAILGINKIIPPVIKLNTKKNKFAKSYKNIKIDLRKNNHTKPHFSNKNQNKSTNNMPNLKFKFNEKCVKNIESKKKPEMDNKKNLNETKSNKPKKEENINTGISLYTTKIEEEGILEMNEVQDLIIYYKLDKESGKDYLFKENDYANFIQDRMKKYLGFYMS